MTSIYDFTAEKLEGGEQNFTEFEGKVLLIVNTASKCGFTYQFEGLESVYQQFNNQGFAVVGFPCNQFGSQDPGSADEIGAFCQRNYGVSFPMMAKIDVKGANAHPIFNYLTKETKGFLSSAIKWNFTKFLIGKDGSVINRYPPTTKPEKIIKDIEKALEQ